MEIVKPSFVIESEIDFKKLIQDVEKFGRVCYKSEDRMDEESAGRFMRKLLTSKPLHGSVLEHVTISVRIICDRGVSHEIVRHRIGSYSQESTRYCNYKSKGVKFIEPLFFVENNKRYLIWSTVMGVCEWAYNTLIEDGVKPEEARTVLPHSLKTEIIVTYNLREWRHFFELRCDKKAHPQMREITIPLLREFQRLVPFVFDDILIEE